MSLHTILFATPLTPAPNFPAIHDEGGAKVERETATRCRRLPGNRERRRCRLSREEAFRIRVQSKRRVEDIEAETKKIVTVCDDVHAIAPRSDGRSTRQWETRAIAAGDRQGELVDFATPDAKTRGRDVSVSRPPNRFTRLASTCASARAAMYGPAPA
jgi:hypothetical protein